MDKPKDFYRVLGVDRKASTSAIRRAYRRLAREQRPEPEEASEVLRELQLAYETLTDAERRRRYDDSLGSGDDRRGSLAWSIVKSPAKWDLRRPIRPGSLSGEILLTPGEAAAGGVMPLDIPLRGSCPACEGTGGPYFDCGRCGGEGSIERRLPVPVKIPSGIRDGAVFQVALDEPGVGAVLLTVHIRAM